MQSLASLFRKSSMHWMAKERLDNKGWSSIHQISYITDCIATVLSPELHYNLNFTEWYIFLRGYWFCSSGRSGISCITVTNLTRQLIKPSLFQTNFQSGNHLENKPFKDILIAWGQSKEFQRLWEVRSFLVVFWCLFRSIFW